MTASLQVVELGLVRYTEAHALQRRLAERVIAGTIASDLLLLLEHERTVTLGRGTKASSLPLAAAELARRGVTVAEVERGGDVTWHGPGQLVGYPILDLARLRPDLHWYLRTLEAALIGGLGTLGIAADRNPGLTGVWTGGRKIASLGIHVKQWITFHGFALNVTTDLDFFDLIVPCGIPGVTMTSVRRELGGRAPAHLWAATREAVVAALAGELGRTAEPWPADAWNLPAVPGVPEASRP